MKLLFHLLFALAVIVAVNSAPIPMDAAEEAEAMSKVRLDKSVTRQHIS